MNSFPWLRRLVLWACGAFLSVLASSLLAQPAPTGTIEGRVLNASSGGYLNQATVVVKGTLLTAATDENGEFRLAGVPAGTATLTVTYTGLEPQTRVVGVAAGGVARADFELRLAGSGRASSEVVQLAAFTVEEREFTAQSQALHEQRTAANIKNVVSIEEFGDLGITNPGHFLTYVPGISNVYNTTGEVEGIGIRGMSSGGTLVMFDGAQAASNDPAQRAYNFSGTATNNLDRIEVTKVPTPDLPANAVGGSINMITKSGFHRRTPQLRYNLLGTIQAKGSHGNFPRLGEKLAGNDDRTTALGIQPGFDLSYLRPISESLALTFNVGRNARYQDREYLSPTWDRVRGVQTSYVLNSVLNIFYQDVAALGADWRTSRHVLRARVDVSRYNAITRQNQFTANFGTGVTGGEKASQGAATGVGTLTQSAGANPNQYRRLFNTRISHAYTGDVWKFDSSVAYSEARRLFSDVDEGMFYSVSSTLSNVLLAADGLDGISTMTLPRLTARSRTGAVLDPYDIRQFTVGSATSGRMYFKNQVGSVAGNATRTFATALPLSLKSGFSVSRTKRDNWTESMTWTFRPPATAGSQLVGSYDLISEAYAQRRVYNGGARIAWVSATKLYDVYRQHPDWFQLNEAGAYTNRANNSKQLEETISSAYLRTDLRAFDNRLWLVAGVRAERTADEGLGPLNDIRNTYVKDAAGRLVLGANGRPIQVTTDALALAKLQYKELGAYSEKSYQGWYPSFNLSYNLTPNLVARTAWARTIGRPDLSFITPGTTISDPSAASPTITVVNTGLEPWTSDNYDLTLEAYEFRGATLSVSGFRKQISKFFTSVRVPATQALLDQFGLPDELASSNYEIITRENSSADAIINGFEWSWRQTFRSFAALPAWARAFGASINGTHLRLTGAGANEFSGYSTRIINWGVSYTRGNFALKANATYSNGPRNAVVAANATTPAGTYSGLAPRMMLGGSLEYRISRWVTLHVSGQNLTNALYRNMTFSPGAPEYTRPTQYRDNGIGYVFGVRGEF
ncbi:MAG: TonB-dependent receptor [Verrucomicrobia bacterium]|nr:TonB-dependent receptor [Verrucomicrobiota bacterium]